MLDVIFGFSRNCSPNEYVILWFYNIFIKTNSPNALNRNGRISKNYITTVNNLVNMIVLLEYFPTSISVCIWKKLYACFYFKDVMNMLLWNFELSVVYKIAWRGIVGLLSLILVIKIMFVETRGFVGS